MKNKGFTLIELLVVIAIIGVLSSIVLTSVGDARDKAKDAAIKSTLSGMRAQAELQFLEDGNYNRICDSAPNVETKSGNMFLSAFLIAGPSGSTNNVCYDEEGVNYDPTGNALPLNNSTSGTGNSTNGSFWIAEVKLHGDGWFCVDGIGNASVLPSRSGTASDKTCDI